MSNYTMTKQHSRFFCPLPQIHLKLEFATSPFQSLHLHVSNIYSLFFKPSRLRQNIISEHDKNTQHRQRISAIDTAIDTAKRRRFDTKIYKLPTQPEPSRTMKPARRKLEELWRLSDAENELQRLQHFNSQPLPTTSDTDSTFSNATATTSPLVTSPWSEQVSSDDQECQSSSSSSSSLPKPKLICSLVRREGHIYSLAAFNDLLYTGSESKNIRVWKNQKEYSGFKSNSGLVKSIILSKNRIFTGHQDGKIRVWKSSNKCQHQSQNQTQCLFKRIGTLPTLKAYIKSSMNPNNYVEVRRKRSVWIKHLDSISSLALSEDGMLLYSASWDRSFKVWRVEDFKCLESIHAHDDSVNSIVTGFDGLVFTGSADGTVKVWKRERYETKKGMRTKHLLSKTLITKDCAITSLAVNVESMQVYSGSSDGQVNFWAGTNGASELQQVGVLKGHKLGVLCLAAAGKLLFSGSADMSIYVWKRLEGGEHVCLAMLTGHAGPVKCLAVEEDKEASSGSDRRWVLYSGSLDRSVKVWKVPEQGRAYSITDDKQRNDLDNN